MSAVTLEKSFLQGEITAPASKSHSHRLLLLSLISGAPITINGSLNGDDITATLNFLKALGVRVGSGAGATTLIPPKAFPDSIVVDIGESGSTLRFALPLCAFLGVSAKFYGKGRLAKRPLNGIKECLKKVGVEVKSGEFPVTVSGVPTSGELELDISESSQYLTGVLFALALNGGSVKVKGGTGSMGYVDMTINVLRECGVDVTVEGDTCFVKKAVEVKREFSVEGDWSGACFFVVAGLINGDVAIKGLKYPSAQPDSAIVELMRSAGGNLEWNGEVLRAKKSTLKNISFNADGCPDIVPSMAIALATAYGVSNINGVGRLRLKESDRVSSVTDMLSSFGIDVTSEGETVNINGGRLTGGNIKTYGDHRIAMSGAIGGLVADGKTTIDNAECVAKSYPDFWKDYIKLGGKVDAE